MDNPLLDPNVIYILLVSGLFFAMLALISPGTGLLEISALFVLLLAGYGIYQLPVNAWALGMILFSVITFMVSLRRQKYWMWSLLGVSAAALISGSIFLFRSEDSTPAVHPALAVIASLSSLGFLWWVARKTLEAISRRPTHSLEVLIGMTGKALTEIHHEGDVYINGEEWTARSDEVITAESTVRVVRRDGLVLLVEVVPTANTEIPEAKQH